jgi:hypothetical protein
VLRAVQKHADAEKKYRKNTMYPIEVIIINLVRRAKLEPSRMGFGSLLLPAGDVGDVC